MFDASKTALIVSGQFNQQGGADPTDAAVEPPLMPLSRQKVSEILGVSVRTLVSIEGTAYWHPAVFYSWLACELRTTDHEEAGAAVAEKERAAGAEKSIRTAEGLSSAARAMSRNRSALVRMASGSRQEWKAFCEAASLVCINGLATHLVGGEGSTPRGRPLCTSGSHGAALGAVQLEGEKRGVRVLE